LLKKDEDEVIVRGRYRLSLLFVIAVGFLLLWRLFQLQIVQGYLFQEEARSNRTREMFVTAPRGRILDVNGVVLAYTRSAFAVSLLDLGNGNVARVIPILATILDAEESELLEKMESNAKFSRMWPIRLIAGITDEQHVKLSENLEKLPGISIDYVPVERVYPQGSALAHAIGYMGALDQDDWDEWAQNAGYDLNELVGKKGLERSQESWLRGEPGRYLVEIDALGNTVRELSRIEPIPGNDVYLTIDIEFQKLAEELLIKSLSTVRMQPMQRYRASYAFSGSLVALDTTDGSILAMVSYPNFDPNAWSFGVIRDPVLRDLYFELALDEDTGEGVFRENLSYHASLVNRAILGALPPGSIYKPVTLAAALECGLVSLSETVFCTGTYEQYADVGVRPRCWIYPDAHRAVNGTQAIRDSCNCYFFEMGRRVGIDLLDQYAAAFGLGEDTGFRDLLYASEDNLESTHRSNTEYKAWAYENGFSFDSDWYEGETIFTAIGQGFNAFTPLQMALMTQQIANEGKRYHPFFVEKVVGVDGKILYRAPIRDPAVLQLKDSTWKAIRDGMIAVTRVGGTSYQAVFGPVNEAVKLWSGLSINVAAKTGTAELGSDVDPSGEKAHGWFIAYAPAEEPRIAIAMVVENGRSGSYACGPTVSSLIREYLQQPQLSITFIEDSNNPWPIGP